MKDGQNQFGSLPEPAHTIYVDSWIDARRRVLGIHPEIRPQFVDVLNHVEHGWAHVRPLQCWFDDHSQQAIGRFDDYAQLLHFIDGDLVDVFRELAFGVAALVPHVPEWDHTVDLDDIDGDADIFARYLTLFRLAVESVPEAFALRDLTRMATVGLADWRDQLQLRLKALEAAISVHVKG